MPKDFAEYVSNPSHNSTSSQPLSIKDPNIYHNFAVKAEISIFSPQLNPNNYI